ncbi:hypothetical protein SAMN05878391_1034 [Salinicoccus kekensis]|uniref:Uncharacterized protein n=2 Tax=Salinicoccus kekensis TaxID=714307 RepID=A0A285UGU7_9STAP|nr:hypothetical protein SAMN05878391_1034 [Salinicoccus kekensis]
MMDKKMSIRVVRKTGVFGFWKSVHFKLDDKRFAEIRNEEELTIDLHREGALFSINYNEVFDLSNKVTVKNGDVVLIRHTWVNYILYALLISILLLPVMFPIYDYFGLWILFPIVLSVIITAKYSNTFKVEVLENIFAAEKSRRAVAHEREEAEEEYGGVINYESARPKPPHESGKT